MGSKPPCRWKNQTTVTPESSTGLNGSRIINLHSLGKFIETVSQHSATCSIGVVKLQGEKYQNGVASILSACCTVCHYELTFPTSSKVSGLSGGKRWECNMAAVWGQMSIGGGHSSLEESMSVLGIPVMTKRSFIASEKQIGQWCMDVLQQTMDEAGKEECRLAVEKGSYHEGVPAITVVVVGGWSKRSHKHSYNAKSGVGIIIGQATGKILYMCIRQKYCAICANSHSHCKDAPEHACYKNWDGPSSSMETDIIVEGFKAAEAQHGLRYIKFVGDGDSSVYPTLINSVPGWGRAIRKLECANHAVKCYRSSLEKLIQEKPKYKGKGKLTESMRKRLTKAARCAIKNRSAERDRKQAIQQLRRDLSNGPSHCFGIHDKCSADYCKVKSGKGVLHHLDDQCTSDSEDVETDSTSFNVVVDIANQEITSWMDATDDTGIEVLPQTTQSIDPQMLCDIQCIAGRLVAKAEYLIGMAIHVQD